MSTPNPALDAAWGAMRNQVLMEQLPLFLSGLCIAAALWYIIGYTIYKNRKRIGDFFR